MALDPATAKLIAKVVISQITDEEKRQRLIIGIIIGIVVFTFIIMIPLFALTSTIDKIKSFFGFGYQLIWFKNSSCNWKAEFSYRNRLSRSLALKYYSS